MAHLLLKAPIVMAIIEHAERHRNNGKFKGFFGVMVLKGVRLVQSGRFVPLTPLMQQTFADFEDHRIDYNKPDELDLEVQRAKAALKLPSNKAVLKEAMLAAFVDCGELHRSGNKLVLGSAGVPSAGKPAGALTAAGAAPRQLRPGP